MQEVTAYQSLNEKIFKTKSEALYEDLTEEVKQYVASLATITNYGESYIEPFIDNLFLKAHRQKDGSFLSIEPKEFVKKISRFRKMKDAAFAQLEAEKAANAVTTTEEEEIPF